MKSITKIVITGGPCGGKSTAMSWIESNLSKQGYKVLFIPETASELILGGVAPWTVNTNYDFQKALVSLQIQALMNCNDNEQSVSWAAVKSPSGTITMPSFIS